MNGFVASGTDPSRHAPGVWVVTAPASRGVFDGISDYASLLAGALASTHHTRVVVSDRDVLPSSDEVRGVLHQYSPHFRSPRLDGWLEAMHAQGVPIIVTVHEYWPPASWSPRRMLLRWKNRRRLVALLRLASAVIVAEEIYQRELQAARVAGGKTIHVIPVGSNITRIETTPVRDGGLVIFAQPAAFRRDHLTAVAGWLTESADRPPLTWIGRSLDELRRAWRDIAPPGSSPVTFVGGADEAVVSALLLRATAGVAPYANGASGRRSTLAAMLQHGVPVVTTSGISTDSWLRASPGLLRVPDDDPAAFVETLAALVRDDDARDRLSRNAEVLYETHMAWPRVADRYRALMSDERDGR